MKEEQSAHQVPMISRENQHGLGAIGYHPSRPRLSHDRILQYYAAFEIRFQMLILANTNFLQTNQGQSALKELSTSAQYNLRSYRLKESDGKGPPAPVQRCGVSDNALGKLTGEGIAPTIYLCTCTEYP